MIPTINIAALFDANSRPGHALATTDLAVFEAATTLGFMAITGLPHEADIDASAKQTLTTLFNLSVPMSSAGSGNVILNPITPTFTAVGFHYIQDPHSVAKALK